ncbi:MAG: hypothetical protein KDA74_19925, partial [Planctomycetaceae bacterium]|nr:hypothetical protein [Planctomycetaceae bacterium]
EFPNANSSLNTGDGDLSLQALNTINLKEVVTTGTVEITSTSGDIRDNNGTASNITAAQATLSALSGEIYHLETVLERIEMIADGRIIVFNTGDLIIGGVGALEGVASVNDRVLVTTIGQMLIQENVTAFDNVLIRTYDSDVVSLNEDIIVKSGVTIQAETYSVRISAADDLKIEEQATLQSTAYTILLEVNYGSSDGAGGVLELYGNVITPGASAATSLGGSNENDIFWVVPSLTSRIIISALDPLPPGPVGDELIYYIPEGETALHVADTDAGTISFTGGYYDIDYGSIESFTLAGSLTLEGTAGDDVLTINATDVNSGTFQLNDGPAVAFTDLSDLTFSGLDGDDRLVINHPTEGLFAPLNGILFEGGDQTYEDSIEILGGTAASVEHRFANEHDGSIFYNGQTTAAITYTGLEPVLDTIAATDRIFSFTGEAETITLSDDGDAGDGESLIDSTRGE